jgi:hypothetical protein
MKKFMYFILLLFLSCSAWCTSYGPFFPSACTNAVSVGGVGDWANPTNAEVEDSVYSTFNEVESYYLYCSNFDFSSIPPNFFITGIQVGMKRIDINGNGVVDTFVQLFESGGPVGNNYGDNVDPWPTVDTWNYYGGQNDLWGLPITLATIKDSSFGCGIEAGKINGPPLFGIDAESITVFGQNQTTIYKGNIDNANIR